MGFIKSHRQPCKKSNALGAVPEHHTSPQISVAFHYFIFKRYTQHVFQFVPEIYAKLCSACLMSHLISCDGDEVHGVIDGLQDAEDGGERRLQVISPLTALTVLQHFL